MRMMFVFMEDSASILGHDPTFVCRALRLLFLLVEMLEEHASIAGVFRRRPCLPLLAVSVR